MAEAIEGRGRYARYVVLHSPVVRITHWLNALAIIFMIGSGWRIYNQEPLFGFKFPVWMTFGGWPEISQHWHNEEGLAGALQWHFAAMWLLALNGVVYLTYGIVSGHFRRKLLPISPGAIFTDIGHALRGKLAHDDLTLYNAAQRAAYLGAIVLAIVLILTGLVIWKPVQFHPIGQFIGDYEGARYLHFFAMSGIVLFVFVHVVMVALVPRTFPSMFTGRIRNK